MKLLKYILPVFISFLFLQKEFPVGDAKKAKNVSVKSYTHTKFASNVSENNIEENDLFSSEFEDDETDNDDFGLNKTCHPAKSSAQFLSQFLKESFHSSISLFILFCSLKLDC